MSHQGGRGSGGDSHACLSLNDRIFKDTRQQMVLTATHPGPPIEQWTDEQMRTDEDYELSVSMRVCVCVCVCARVSMRVHTGLIFHVDGWCDLCLESQFV